MSATWIADTDYAHRGLHGLSDGCPENSLAAIEEAIHCGYGIEIDVQRSADYDAVVFHDTTLNRLTRKVGPVVNWSSGELSKTRLANSTQTIPTLREVLDLVNGRTPLLIEIKAATGVSVPGVLEQRIAGLLERYDGPVGVMSFSPNPLALLGILSPRTLVGNIVTRTHRTNVLRQTLKTATKIVRTLGATAIAKSDFVAIDRNILDDDSFEKVRRRGKPVLAWTVTSEEEAETALERADALIFEGFRPARRD